MKINKQKELPFLYELSDDSGRVLSRHERPEEAEAELSRLAEISKNKTPKNN